MCLNGFTGCINTPRAGRDRCRPCQRVYTCENQLGLYCRCPGNRCDDDYTETEPMIICYFRESILCYTLHVCNGCGRCLVPVDRDSGDYYYYY